MNKKVVQALLLSTMIPSVANFSVTPDGVQVIQTTTINQSHFNHDSIKIYQTTTETEKRIQEEKKRWKKGYVTATSLNIRKNPSKESEIVGCLLNNEKVKYYVFNKKWFCIKYKDEEVYIYSKYVSNKKQKENINYTDHTVPVTSGFKSYMPYTAITSYSSPQAKLQQKAYTGTYGIRQVGERYCVAIGTAFNAKVGTYFDLILANGTVIPCIVGDIKANQHTDSNNMITVANGCLTEFIVDFAALNSKAKQMGDVSYCNENWNSRVKTIRVYR